MTDNGNDKSNGKYNDINECNWMVENEEEPFENLWHDNDILGEDNMFGVEEVGVPCDELPNARERLPCENCSCGLQSKRNDGTMMAKSNCGGCYLGDAFRCGGCPYLGKDPFDPNNPPI